MFTDQVRFSQQDCPEFQSKVEFLTQARKPPQISASSWKDVETLERGRNRLASPAGGSAKANKLINEMWLLSGASDIPKHFESSWRNERCSLTVTQIRRDTGSC